MSVFVCFFLPSFPSSFLLMYNMIVHVCVYRIAGIFQAVKFSWFSWLRGEPQNFTHETVLHSTGVWFSISQPQKVLHKLAKFTAHKNFTPRKYPLYGISSSEHPLPRCPSINRSLSSLSSLPPPVQAVFIHSCQCCQHASQVQQ